MADSMSKMSLNQDSNQPRQEQEKSKAPFGGIALPGMAPPIATATQPDTNTARQSSSQSQSSIMPPPPVPPAMTMPEPRIPSRQSTREVNEDDDPMARALADLRRDPPPSGSIRRAPSHRRPDSIHSNAGSTRGSAYGHVQSPPSPAPAANRSSFQQQPQRSRGSVDLGLSPPAPGHTSAALAKSMADFERQSSTAPSKRQSTHYSNYADDVVGAHPSSPGPQARGPSPAMMQPPVNPASPIADEVLSQYHQAFPGERSRPVSRAGSVSSRRSRGGSFTGPNPPASNSGHQPQHAPASPGPAREGFVGIGAGGRSNSPNPMRSPSPNPGTSQGVLGPQNLGISLDERGGVSHDSMAEAYRRQYGQQQQQQQQQPNTGYTPHSQSQAQAPNQGSYSGMSTKSPSAMSFGNTRPLSGFVQSPIQQNQPQHFQQPQSQPQQAYQLPSPSQQQQQYPYQQQHQPNNQGYAPPMNNAPSVNNYQSHSQNGYGGSGSASGSQGYGGPQQYGRSASPAPQPQHEQYGRGPSPQPYGGQGQGQGQQQHQQRGMQRSPSPQPGVPPSQAAPTGQWSTTGLPVLFCMSSASY